MKFIFIGATFCVQARMIALRKLPFIMKLSCLGISSFLLCTNLLLAGPGSAQKFKETKIVLGLEGEPLLSAIKQIEGQTNFNFAYVESQLTKYEKIYLLKKTRSLQQTIELILYNTDLKFSVKRYTIVIFRDRKLKKEETEESSADEDVQQPTLIAIKGRVADQMGNPLSNVSVVLKGSPTGVTTDAAGLFNISVPNEKAVLIISAVGYITQEIVVGDNRDISINLIAGDVKLDEVVVVGYGTQTKKNLASATSKVSAKEFKQSVVNTVDQALQGRATGIQVTNQSGEPGANAVIRIRGSNSLSGNNEPLYVIDGVIMPSYAEAPSMIYGAYTQNGLYGINPNDIENIEILKDASATAIFGSRGANGVVVITTKAGRRSDAIIEVVNKTSIGSIAKPIRMMNGKQFAEVWNEYSVYSNRPAPFGNIDTISTNTDWIDLITRNTFREDIGVSVSGGNAKSSYYISGNHLADNGLLIGSDLKRESIRANLRSALNKWYTITAQFSFVHQNALRGISSNGGWPNGGGFMEAIRNIPLYKPTDNGDKVQSPIPGGGTSWFGNPVIEQLDKQDVSKNDYSIINLQNLFTITPDLKLSINLSKIQNLTRRQAFFPTTTVEGFYGDGRGDNGVANTYNYNLNAFLQYDKTLATDHALALTLGGEYIKDQLESLTGTTSGLFLPSLGVNNLSSAAAQQTFSYKEERVIESGFFRANYAYKAKYILNASVRIDGASPFAENNKRAWFPAIGMAWNLDKENFMISSSFINSLKLRGSYGVVGSQAIAPYSSLARYGTDYYQVGSVNTLVVFPFTLGNNNLTWEQTKQFDLGIDFSGWNGRINFSFDYYKKLTDGLLQPRQLPSQSGNSFIIDNYGRISNKGVELSLGADIIRKDDITLTSRFNFSRNINTLDNLGDRTAPQFQSLSGNLQGGVYGVLAPGHEIGQFYGYKIIGLTQASDFKNGQPNYPFPSTGQIADQRPGGLKYADLDGNGAITIADETVLGKSSPDFTYGWVTDLNWKNWGLSVFFTGSYGNDILNMTGHYQTAGLVNNGGIFFNQTEEWYKHRWTSGNPTTDVNFPATQTNAASGDINSTMVEDGSYFRLKQLSLSYGFPKLKFVKNARIFLTGTNLFTITKYTGYDPEVSNFGIGLLQQGIDYGAYPSQRSFTIGLSVSF